MKVYSCDPSTGTMSSSSVTLDNSASALTGDQEDTSTTTFTAEGNSSYQMVLKQAREDPDTYTSGTYPDIYGIYNTGYIQKFTWSANTLTATTSYLTVPIDH